MKSKFKKGVFLLAVLLSGSQFASAQVVDSTIADSAKSDAKPILSFTVEEAKQYALEHNRAIQNASFDVQKAEANRWKSIASMLLQASGNVTYSNMLGYDMEMMGAKIAMPPYMDFAISASFTVGGQQIVGVQLAKLSKQLYETTIGKTEQSVTSNIETYYVNILALEKTVLLLEQNLNNLTNLHKMTLNAVKAGVAEQNDADQIEIQVSSMTSAINTAKRSIEVLYNSIRLMTGANADDEIVLTQKLEDVISPEAILALMGTEFDMYDNYDYRLQEKAVEISKKQVALNKMAYVPNLTAYYSFDKKKYFSDEATLDMTPPNVVGLKLTVPIFSSGSRWADVRSAKMDYAKSLNQLEDAKQNLDIQEKQLRYNLTSTYEDFMIQSNNIAVMQRVFNSNSEKFKYGTISSMALTTSSTDLVAAQNTYVSSLLEMVSAYVSLRNLLNK
jgi:outer membrane protein TolC